MQVSSAKTRQTRVASRYKIWILPQIKFRPQSYFCPPTDTHCFNFLRGFFGKKAYSTALTGPQKIVWYLFCCKLLRWMDFSRSSIQILVSSGLKVQFSCSFQANICVWTQMARFGTISNSSHEPNEPRINYAVWVKGTQTLTGFKVYQTF